MTPMELVLLACALLVACCLGLWLLYTILRATFAMGRHSALASTACCSMLAISLLRLVG
jgi:hypothetical protein